MKKFIERMKRAIEEAEEFMESILFVGVLLFIYGLYYLEKAIKKIKKDFSLGISDALFDFPFPGFFGAGGKEVAWVIDGVDEGIAASETIKESGAVNLPIIVSLN